MLSIKNLKAGKGGSGAASIAKYCEHGRDVEKGTGYYSQAGGAPSFWHGTAARELELDGPVSREVFVSALEGRLPDGTDISARGNVEARRLGVDLTFSAPKSVSIAGLAAGDSRILEAHDRAVRAGLDFIEREVLVARHGHGGVQTEHTGKMLAAAYRHEDSRPVDGHSDPQLHSHCIIVNATQRADGTWSAMDLQFGEHSVLMHLADAHYKNELACELRAMGYDIRRTEDGFELAHISDKQIEHFSARTQQIDEALAERGLSRETSSAEDRTAANLATREDKQQIDRDTQAWSWREEARAQAIELAQPSGAKDVARTDLAAEAVKSGTRHIAERETLFGRDALRLESLKAGMGDTTLSSVDREITGGRGGLLDAGKDDKGRDQFTTRDALLREQHILERVRGGAGQTKALMNEAQAQQFIAAREAWNGMKYSDGQREAIKLALTSPDRVNVVVGAAGAGKTTSMREIVNANREAGHEVIGIAPSARARNELESAGAETNRTIASFLAREREYNPQRLVILDEAGMVSARDMDALLEKLEREGGRLLLVGDPRQLQAVEAGAPFAQMIEAEACRIARIDEIKRQVDPELRAIAQSFADGKAAEAVERAKPYMREVQVDAANHGKPTVVERRDAISRDAATAYLSLSKDEREKTLVLSGTNAVRRQANDYIRSGLQEKGEVSREQVQIRALDKSDLTREQATRAEHYSAGMVVRLEERHGREHVQHEYTVQRNDGHRVELKDANGNEKNWNPAREKAAGIYEPREMHLAAGDVVIFRENQGRGAEKVVNGQTATIERADRDGITARMDDGREIHLDPERGQCIDHGWCRTVHASQGATVGRVIVAGEASRVATAETAYVACSREREALQIVTDSKEKLASAWETYAEKKYAAEHARGNEQDNNRTLSELRSEASKELGKEGDLSTSREQARELERVRDRAQEN